MILDDRDERAIAQLQRDCPLVAVAASVDPYMTWQITGTHAGEVKVQASGRIWSLAAKKFRNAYYNAKDQGMFQTKEPA